MKRNEALAILAEHPHECQRFRVKSLFKFAQ